MNSGRHLLTVSFSGFDLGCVKTRMGEECAELFSQLPSSERSCQYNRLPYRRNRDGSSTRKLDIGVFTQPGPISDIVLKAGPIPAKRVPRTRIPAATTPNDARGASVTASV